MTEYIDEMLHLTADIAEELLTLKDTGRGVDANLCNRINRLAQLASDNMKESHECPITPKADDEADPTLEPAIQPENDSEVLTSDTPLGNEEMASDETPGINVAINADADEPQSMPTEARMEESVESESARTPQPTISIHPDSNDVPLHSAFSPEQIRNAFSINDIFLFQRTLFRGSPHRMAETLETAANCASMDELRNYLSGQQHINLRSDEAIDFMGIIAPFLPR